MAVIGFHAIQYDSIGFKYNWKPRHMLAPPANFALFEPDNFPIVAICTLEGYKSPHPPDMYSQSLSKFSDTKLMFCHNCRHPMTFYSNWMLYPRTNSATVIYRIARKLLYYYSMRNRGLASSPPFLTSNHRKEHIDNCRAHVLQTPPWSDSTTSMGLSSAQVYWAFPKLEQSSKLANVV